MTSLLSTPNGSLAYDDLGGDGELVVMLPGAGDVRSEHRLLGAELRVGGRRVVLADLRGHGESSPDFPSYGVAETAADIAAIIRHLDAGPATIVATSFAPAAALWAAAEQPDLVAGIVAISPHLENGGSAVQSFAIDLLLRGPLAGALWTRLYKRWYKGNRPADLDAEIAKIEAMMREPHRRRAVRDTLLADREGLAERIARVDKPLLAIFGDADDHFPDPESEAKRIAAAAGGSYVMIRGAGHYPHVEQPAEVASAVGGFLATRT